MNAQIEISFIHSHENNHDSRRHLEENRLRFWSQCSKLKQAFERGERLTTMGMILKYEIGDPRRRIKDLIDHNGMNISSEWVRDENKTRYKVYYLKQ